MRTPITSNLVCARTRHKSLQLITLDPCSWILNLWPKCQNRSAMRCNACFYSLATVYQEHLCSIESQIVCLNSLVWKSLRLASLLFQISDVDSTKPPTPHPQSCLHRLHLAYVGPHAQTIVMRSCVLTPQVIDPTAPRYTALSKESAVPVHVADAKEVRADAAKHPKVWRIAFHWYFF